MKKQRPNEQYINYDPFSGDRDGPEVRNRTVKVVVTRKPHWCAGNNAPEGHTIPAGTRARYESAVVDGRWCAYWYCTDCLDRWFEAIGE